MLTNVSSADYLITGDSVQQKENVQGIGKSASPINIYTKQAEFDDSLEISDEAKNLFQKEKEIQYYSSMVMESAMSSDETAAILKLIEKGEFIDNKDLAEALEGDQDLIRHLFS